MSQTSTDNSTDRGAMAAGASAGQEAHRSLLEAKEYERLRRDAQDRAARYHVASRAEEAVEHRLAALAELGWRVLADRRWAGSKRANVDFILVGPGGVVVVDVKAWRSLQVREGRIFCDDDCRDDEASKLLALTDRVEDSLAGLGLTRQAIRAALVFAGRRVNVSVGQVQLLGDADVAPWAARLGHRLSREQIDRVAGVLEADFPPYPTDDRPSAKVPRLRVVMPKRRTVQDDALFEVEHLTDALVEAALAGPIESWMTFLHPEQNRLVTASWNGPARVRGPAGTGKTVVGLHRAVYLAERLPQQVLFVTFVKTLPAVMAGLCQRMSPTARDNIDFTGLHRLAFSILDQAGVRIRLERRQIDLAFAESWREQGHGTTLARLDERRAYWKEEIDHVIKGRGLTDFEEYAELNRVGRRTPMRSEHREAMWVLYVDYERRLKERGLHDFNDLLLIARDLVRDGDVPCEYAAVIVDEVQDLNLVGVELLYAIAGDGPDRFFIIGDGQQSVYPGGFTLSEAGVSVTGRATVLRSNYRNASEVLEVAAQVVAEDTFDDLDGDPVAGRRDLEVRRSGGTALIARPDDTRSLHAALVTQIRDTHEHLGVAWGDMAVLVATNSQLGHYRSILSRADVPLVGLLEYDGVSTDRVKIGTFKRAKGLEFKYVLMPDLRDGPITAWDGESADSCRERGERLRRELYVGMTRARDGLWLGYLPG